MHYFFRDILKLQAVGQIRESAHLTAFTPEMRLEPVLKTVRYSVLYLTQSAIAILRSYGISEVR